MSPDGEVVVMNVVGAYVVLPSAGVVVNDSVHVVSTMGGVEVDKGPAVPVLFAVGVV